MIPVSSSFMSGVYANVRQFNSQMYFTCAQLNGGARTLYDDSRIINFDLVEETTTLNDSVPSDQLTIELDNTDGAFNFLNISNMQTIIAGRPKIELQIGLNEANFQPDNWAANYVGKVAGSLTANGNSWRYTNGASSLLAPSSITTEAGQGSYNAVQSIDGTTDTTSTTTNGYQPQDMYCFDIIRILTDHFGSGIWGGATDLPTKVSLARQYISSITTNAYVYGVTPTGNKAYSKWWNGSSWSTGGSNTASSPTNISITSTSMNTYIGSDGFLYMLVTTDASNGTITSKNIKDYIEIVITTNAIYADEWIPFGTFYVDSWKNQVKSVILTAHDNLMFLDNIAYVAPAPSSRTLQAIAQDIFSQAGISSGNYQLDPVLATITSNGFKQASSTNSSTLTCRQALQHLAIASQCTVYQDRNGVMQIKSFGTLDSASLYSNYPTSTTMGTGMASLWGYPVANTQSSSSPPTPISSNFINENTAGGMRYLGLSQMFDLPIITLEASVYQLSINVYDTNFNSTPQVFTNGAVSAGSNGQSFTIDNPLVNTVAQATAIANWFIGEANYNAVYQANWRGNPCLTPTDVVVVENGHPDGNGGVIIDSIKQSRIYRNEFNYNGYLTATTQARGGL